jgi:ClpP class serine protease
MLARAFHFDPAVQEAAKAQRWNRYAVHQQTSVLVDGSQALYRRGRTAILPITGPIIRRGNLLSSLSGGPMTSVEMLAKDFTRAVEDDAFDAILLDVDSPGGEASGISELAGIISQARDTKPITAYVGDLAASAAYWLASAASEVVVHRMAALGSIGVVMAVPDPSASPKDHVEFVSSVSPNKRPDPTSKEGKSELQTLVDALADIFVEDVAAQRGVSVEAVTGDFGRGGLRVGADAVEHGMADRLGTFEEVVADLNGPKKGTRRPVGGTPPPEPPDPEPDEEPTESAPDRPRSVPAIAAASSTHAGGVVVPNLLDSLRTLVASADAPASADREAHLMSQHIEAVAGDPPGVTGTGTSAHAHIAATTIAAAAATDADATLRMRLVSAEAENARLRFAQIQARAEVFARARADELRVFPPEMPHLVALYCVLASDDETHGPIQLGQGKTTTRVSHLENLLAARASRKELTEDVFGDTVAHVLTERARPKADPNAEADTGQLAAYLGQTATGRAALARIAASGQNG